MCGRTEPLYYEKLTSFEVGELLKDRTLFVPVGAIEQHGPHLPLSVDMDIASAFAVEMAKRHNGIVAPKIPYAGRSLPQSGGGSGFPGTIHISGDILLRYFKDIFASYVRAGASDVVVVNGHYENEPFLFESLELLREEGRLADTKFATFSWWSMVSGSFVRQLSQDEFPGWHAEHAGLTETSLMMYIDPENVEFMLVENQSIPTAGLYVHPVDPDEVSNKGVLSSTRGASREVGRELFEHVCNRFAELLSDQKTRVQAGGVK